VSDFPSFPPITSAFFSLFFPNALRLNAFFPFSLFSPRCAERKGAGGLFSSGGTPFFLLSPFFPSVLELRIDPLFPDRRLKPLFSPLRDKPPSPLLSNLIREGGLAFLFFSCGSRSSMLCLLYISLPPFVMRDHFPFFSSTSIEDRLRPPLPIDRKIRPFSPLMNGNRFFLPFGYLFAQAGSLSSGAGMSLFSLLPPAKRQVNFPPSPPFPRPHEPMHAQSFLPFPFVSPPFDFLALVKKKPLSFLVSCAVIAGYGEKSSFPLHKKKKKTFFLLTHRAKPVSFPNTWKRPPPQTKKISGLSSSRRCRGGYPSVPSF